MYRKILTTVATLTAAVGLTAALTACDAREILALSPLINDPVATTAPGPQTFATGTTRAPVPDRETRTPVTTPAADAPTPAPTATTSSGTSSSTTTTDTRRSKIYHNSAGFEFLERPGQVVPGGKFITDSGTACSFGWMVFSRTETNGRKYMVTAGHCGRQGDRVYIRGDDGYDTEVGEIVDSTGGRLGNGSDYALVEVTNTTRNARLPLTDPDFDGWKSQAWVAANAPRICRLGYRTGISCGNYLQMKNNTIFYEGIQDHGDSGGPVWAETGDGKRYAIGVTSYGFAEDATAAGAAALEPWMAKFDLGIYTS